MATGVELRVAVSQEKRRYSRYLSGIEIKKVGGSGKTNLPITPIDGGGRRKEVRTRKALGIGANRVAVRTTGKQNRITYAELPVGLGARKKELDQGRSRRPCPRGGKPLSDGERQRKGASYRERWKSPYTARLEKSKVRNRVLAKRGQNRNAAKVGDKKRARLLPCDVWTPLCAKRHALRKVSARGGQAEHAQ